MPLKLTPIKPKRIADQVFEQLQEMIFRGEYKPGQKIMTERELAETLQVSRTSVRNATNKLVVMGLLEQRQGQGTFIRMPNAKPRSFMLEAMLSQNASLRDLLEVRIGLECNAATLAARRATESDIEFLDKSLKDIDRDVRSGSHGSDADTRFHMAIAYATHNPLQIYIMKQFYDFLFYSISENLTRLYRDPRQIDIIQGQHRKILDAIRMRDSEQASEATLNHIQHTIQTIGDGQLDADAINGKGGTS